jgi:hypothetical protein
MEKNLKDLSLEKIKTYLILFVEYFVCFAQNSNAELDSLIVKGIANNKV